jgi:hypothetical protein
MLKSTDSHSSDFGFHRSHYGNVYFIFICRSAKGIMHMRIKRDASSRQFQLSDFSRTFLTIPDMVYHYTRYRSYIT